MSDFSMIFSEAVDYYNKKFLDGLSEGGDNPITQFLKDNGYKNEELSSNGLCGIKHSGENKSFYDKINIDTVKSLKIGFADRDEQGLYNFLRSKNYTDQELLASNLFYIADGPVIKDKFWHSIILPARAIDDTLISLISKRINKNFSQNCFLNISVPDCISDRDFEKTSFFCPKFDGKKRGYVILCENPFMLIYHHDQYVYNSIHFFDGKIEITEELLSLIRDFGNTVKLHMFAGAGGAMRAAELKKDLQSKNVFVL